MTSAGGTPLRRDVRLSAEEPASRVGKTAQEKNRKEKGKDGRQGHQMKGRGRWLAREAST